ncbi:FMN reductase [Microlunatus speluncae]|uniref:FMN reductase n=1 Tax=Microlunatus speluncae TaxID=2594267 RepID=UPI001266187E|nr:FMN reductase [Microlunatus speluncae]
MTDKIMVISAGLSQPSSTRLLADRLGDATRRALGDHDVRLEAIDLREYAHEITDHLLTGFAGPNLKAVLDELAEADALIAVTPIFSASYSGLFKSFFDIVDPDRLAGKPVLIGATGGTARHSLALEFAVRPLFSYLRAPTAPTAVFAATDDWGQVRGAAAGTDQHLTERIERAAGELAAMITGATPPADPDPYDSPVPFERLLHRRD